MTIVLDRNSMESREPTSKPSWVAKRMGTIMAALLKTQKLVLGSCRSRSLLRATSTLPNTQPNSLWSLDVVVDGGFVVEAATGARETVTGTVDGDDGRCGQADREGRLSYCWRNCINYRQKRL